MPMLITHAAIPLSLGFGPGRIIIAPLLRLAGVALAMLPDADVLAFKFGVVYDNIFGHRGFTHSVLFALVVPLLCLVMGCRKFYCGLSLLLWLYRQLIQC